MAIFSNLLRFGRDQPERLNIRMKTFNQFLRESQNQIEAPTPVGAIVETKTSVQNSGPNKRPEAGKQ
jgi:hypothetical protein